MKFVTALSAVLFCICLVLYKALNTSLLLSLSITFGTILYHFSMRLLVGHTVHSVFHNKVKYCRWFHTTKTEENLYRFLRVKRWKKYVPSYLPETFSMKLPPNEIIGAMCQAELVHQIIVVCSFLPVFLAIPFGEVWVFVITSVIAALIDTVFIILQRYNRPRVMKLMQKESKKQ